MAIKDTTELRCEVCSSVNEVGELFEFCESCGLLLCSIHLPRVDHDCKGKGTVVYHET